MIEKLRFSKNASDLAGYTKVDGATADTDGLISVYGKDNNTDVVIYYEGTIYANKPDGDFHYNRFSEVFTGYSSLKEIHFDNLDMSNTSEITDLFASGMEPDITSPIEKIYGLENWNLSNVIIIDNLFYNCPNLIIIDGMENWDTSNVFSINGTFRNCYSLTSLQSIENWNLSNCTNIGGAFSGCSSLQSLNLSNWDVSQVTNAVGIFEDCSSLTSLDLSNWNTSNFTNISFMFQNCSSLTSLNLSGWNTSSIYAIDWTFIGCNLQELNLNNWDLSGLVDTGVPGMQFAFGLDDYVMSNYVLGTLAPQFKDAYDTAVTDNDLTTKKQIMSGVLETFGLSYLVDDILATNIQTIKCPQTASQSQMIPLPYCENGMGDHYTPSTGHFLTGNNTILTRIN